MDTPPVAPQYPQPTTQTAQWEPNSELTPEQAIKAQMAHGVPPTNDPAFQPPRDRLANVDRVATASTITRDIPITTVNTSWDISAVREAMQLLNVGLFDQPAQLVESIVGDSRVQAALEQTTGSLLSCPLTFTTPPGLEKDPIAKKCLSEWENLWPLIAGEEVMAELLQWSSQLRIGPAQLLWDTSSKDVWRPYVQVINPRYMYYHWLFRCFILVGMDGQYPVFGGDGHFVLHAPSSEYRGWIRGAMRAVAPWWLARNYALRDWARYSERNGMPWVVGKTPANGDKIEIAGFREALSLLGQETAMVCPQGVDEKFSYSVELLEAKIAEASGGFKSLIDMCNGEITLALMGQNLTTEVSSGSLAAAEVHEQGSNQKTQASARSLAKTVNTQIARPFALFNYGDAKYAPVGKWDTTPPDNKALKSQTFANFAKGIADLSSAGVRVKNIAKLAKSMGLSIDVVMAALDQGPEGSGAPPRGAPMGRGAPASARVSTPKIGKVRRP